MLVKINIFAFILIKSIYLFMIFHLIEIMNISLFPIMEKNNFIFISFLNSFYLNLHIYYHYIQYNFSHLD